MVPLYHEMYALYNLFATDLVYGCKGYELNGRFSVWPGR